MDTINTTIAVSPMQCFATRLRVLLGRDMAGCCRRSVAVVSRSNVNDLYFIIILWNISATTIYPNRVSVLVIKYGLWYHCTIIEGTVEHDNTSIFFILSITVSVFCFIKIYQIGSWKYLTILQCIKWLFN